MKKVLAIFLSLSQIVGFAGARQKDIDVSGIGNTPELTLGYIGATLLNTRLGIMVADVIKGEPAYKSELKATDIIQAVDGVPEGSFGTFEKAVRAGVEIVSKSGTGETGARRVGRHEDQSERFQTQGDELQAKQSP